jgi:hypothetical protein
MIIEPQTLVGTWRRFGPVGPVYEIISTGRETNSDQIMRVRLVETGEEADYPLTSIIDDPRER